MEADPFITPSRTVLLPSPCGSRPLGRIEDAGGYTFWHVGLLCGVEAKAACRGTCVFVPCIFLSPAVHRTWDEAFMVEVAKKLSQGKRLQLALDDFYVRDPLGKPRSRTMADSGDPDVERRRQQAFFRPDARLNAGPPDPHDLERWESWDTCLSLEAEQRSRKEKALALLLDKLQCTTPWAFFAPSILARARSHFDLPAPIDSEDIAMIAVSLIRRNRTSRGAPSKLRDPTPHESFALRTLELQKERAQLIEKGASLEPFEAKLIYKSVFPEGTGERSWGQAHRRAGALRESIASYRQQNLIIPFHRDSCEVSTDVEDLRLDIEAILERERRNGWPRPGCGGCVFDKLSERFNRLERACLDGWERQDRILRRMYIMAGGDWSRFHPSKTGMPGS